jgi:hypothetical protein
MQMQKIHGSAQDSANQKLMVAESQFSAMTKEPQSVGSGSYE